MESNFEKAIRETIEGKVLQHGDYCEVTREQAIELLIIEAPLHDPINSGYIAMYFGKYTNVFIRFDGDQILLSGFKHGAYVQQLPFDDFKQRLVNTVKG
jgi:hypothetical protein